MRRRAYPDEYENEYDDDYYRGPRRRRGCWVILVSLVLLAVCIGGTIGFLQYLGGEANDIRITEVKFYAYDESGRGDEFSSSQGIGVDQTFIIDFTVRNVSVEAVTLDGVGVDQSLLKGLEVIGIAFGTDGSIRSVSGEDRNVPFFGDWRQFEMEQQYGELLDGDELDITLQLKATEAGSYSGDLTVWIEDSFLGIPISRPRREALDLEVK